MDTIADMLTRIRNAQLVRKTHVDIPYSNVKLEIAKVLSKSGFSGEVEKIGRKEKKTLRVFLKYDKGESAIRFLRRVSKPGRRVYAKKDKIFPVAGKVRIISTPKGVMTDREARKEGVGGEVMCEVM